MREATVRPTAHPIIRPAAVVLACTVLALTTAGLGMMVTFRGLAPWNGMAVCLISLAVATGCSGVTYLRRHHGHH
ncbi:MAG: hypothetical protein JWM61_67 [Micrococcaceae bacterium]|jgi:hypothetical protein|uniref:hypothetical protein n=1 Tax=Arthrobacter sp. PL16 TaxID=3071720 RepID=UPI002E09821A|nr:hypothetical protein [Micrococcaceae bacterium]MEC5198713.1 hypothetical protein [Arthrobacter sp. PL16]